MMQPKKGKGNTAAGPLEDTVSVSCFDLLKKVHVYEGADHILGRLSWMDRSDKLTVKSRMKRKVSTDLT